MQTPNLDQLHFSETEKEFQQILQTAKEEGRINESSLEWAETAIAK